MFVTFCDHLLLALPVGADYRHHLKTCSVPAEQFNCFLNSLDRLNVKG